MIEVYQAHTRASDIRIPDIAAPTATANLQPTEAGVSLVTEAAVSHASATPNGMFDGDYTHSKSGVIGTETAVGEVELNAKYAGYMLWNVRYSRNGYSNSVRKTGAREFSIEYMDDDGVWQLFTNVAVPSQATHTDINFSANPLQLPESRRLRFTMLRNWEDTTGVHWYEFGITVATYQT